MVPHGLLVQPVIRLDVSCASLTSKNKTAGRVTETLPSAWGVCLCSLGDVCLCWLNLRTGLEPSPILRLNTTVVIAS